LQLGKKDFLLSQLNEEKKHPQCKGCPSSHAGDIKGLNFLQLQRPGPLSLSAQGYGIGKRDRRPFAVSCSSSEFYPFGGDLYLDVITIMTSLSYPYLSTV
jgi:hypothetical protein